MAVDQELSALVSVASLLSTDIIYLVRDPGGVAEADNKAAVSVLDARFATAAQGALAATALQDAPINGSQYARLNGAWAVVSAGAALPVADTTAVVMGSVDNTKLLRFEVDGFTAGATRVMTPPDADVTIAGLEVAQTFTQRQTFASDILINNVARIAAPGNQNFLLGEEAAESLTTGTGNFFIGYRAGKETENADFNLGVGYSALRANISGASNVAIGYNALELNSSGGFNVAIGASALGNTTANQNVAIGYQAMLSNTTGNTNVAIGYRAMRTIVGRIRSVAIGLEAMESADLDRSIAVGYQAGQSASGDDNVFLGYQAGLSSTGGNKLYIANTNTATPLIYGEFNNGLVQVNGSSSATAAIVNTLFVNRFSTGTPAAGFGPGIIFQGESSTTESQSMGRLTYEWATATHASRKALSKWTVFDTAEREGIRIEASGSVAMLGVLGATAIARQAHIVDADGTLADITTKFNSLLAYLENFGFIATS